jgi:hypothetical protein
LIVTLAMAAVVAGCGGSSHAATTTGTAASGSTGSTATTGATTTGSTGSTGTVSTVPAPGPLGFENVPIEPGPVLAPNTTGTGVVHGIACGPTEQLVYHIHAHLAVFVDGQPRALPGGIGIPGSVVEPTAKGPAAFGGQCIYWLHTHAPDGVIHIESPTQRIYKLGEFFDEWQQPLTGDKVAGAKGKVTAFVNGKRWAGDVRSIPLNQHTVIQLDVGTPIPPFETIDWSKTQL